MWPVATCRHVFFLPAGPSYASLLQPEEPALESELDKRGLADEFVSMLMAAESPERVSYLNSAFRSFINSSGSATGS